MWSGMLWHNRADDLNNLHQIAAGRVTSLMAHQHPFPLPQQGNAAPHLITTAAFTTYLKGFHQPWVVLLAPLSPPIDNLVVAACISVYAYPLQMLPALQCVVLHIAYSQYD